MTQRNEQQELPLGKGKMNDLARLERLCSHYVEHHGWSEDDLNEVKSVIAEGKQLAKEHLQKYRKKNLKVEQNSSTSIKTEKRKRTRLRSKSF